MLTDIAIKEAIRENFIVIKPFDENRLNPNSYDLTLHNKLISYKGQWLDGKNKSTLQDVEEYEIPEAGFKLYAGDTYLARTVEWTETFNYVPTLHGKSGVGRMFLEVSTEAGYGDNGFRGYWTLQLKPSHKMVLYPGMPIVQIQYSTLTGRIGKVYDGHYQNSKDIVTSRINESI